jgi:LacI family transcriptional regulator
MERQKKRMRRICIIADRSGKGGRDRLSGVLRYGSRTPDWTMEVISIGQRDAEARMRTIFKERPPDAIVLLTDDRKTIRFIESAQRDGRFTGGVMIMDAKIDAVAHIRRSLDIRLDDEAIARTSMELLIRRGLANFAYVGFALEPQHSNARREAIRRIAEENGSPFASTDDADDIVRLSDWLKELPRPCGVVTYYDMRARDVLDACRLARLDVPGQIAIIGSDNDTGLCEATQPTITSVHPDFEGGAYEGAAEFDKIIRKNRLPEKTITMTYGIRGIVERASTVDLSGGRLLVSMATAFIRLNAMRPIKVGDVASHCRVSLRLLELRFKAVLNRGVRDEIENVRLANVKQMLRETDLAIKEIGYHCGFQSPASLCTVFKRKFGKSPQVWRTDERLNRKALVSMSPP